MQKGSRGNPERTVEVTMGGRPYRLRGNDPETLIRLAAEVDSALADVSPHAAPIEDIKIAVLAALNLAGDRDAERRALREKLQATAERIAQLETRLRQTRAVAVGESH
ncbi:MAG: cell division protein ZapA [Acidobacteriota bacterium]